MNLPRRQRPWCEGLTHEQKLEEAKNRYGRTFRCAEQVGTLAQETRKIVDAGREIPKWLERRNDHSREGNQYASINAFNGEGGGGIVGHFCAANILPCRRRKNPALPIRRRG
jgi:hypothetical protein